MAQGDDMLRVYRIPNGGRVFVFAARIMVFVWRDGTFDIKALPEDDGEAFLRTCVTQNKWKRERSVNINLEEQIEAVVLLHDTTRKEAKGIVKTQREFSARLMNSIRASIELRREGPDGETVTKWEGGEFVTRKVEGEDILDAEEIG